MERLADRVILVWGFKRALLAILAGAIGVIALPPIGFFAAMTAALIAGVTGPDPAIPLRLPVRSPRRDHRDKPGDDGGERVAVLRDAHLTLLRMRRGESWVSLPQIAISARCPAPA